MKVNTRVLVPLPPIGYDPFLDPFLPSVVLQALHGGAWSEVCSEYDEACEMRFSHYAEQWEQFNDMGYRFFVLTTR